MDLLQSKISQLHSAAQIRVERAHNERELEEVKSCYLGKNGELTALLRQLVNLDPAARRVVGQSVNDAKDALILALKGRRELLLRKNLEQNLAQEAIDVTLPARGQLSGGAHPITKIRRKLESFFTEMGFAVVEGPEIESEFYNFTALNIPLHHPARTAQDTFYFADRTILRTQTSPVQIRAMERLATPLRIVCPGRVFRRDSDATHSPMFHQLEMLMVDQKLSFANLKWLVAKFIRHFFSEDTEYRFRPSYFPFTEPSAEVDILWKVGGRERWLELGGCGVVHPQVLRAVHLDPEQVRGIAFGFGIERLAMSYYGIDDIRRLFENDLQFLGQFSGF